MTNEEWDRKAEFLLNQQAKFEAGMQELKEAQKINEQKSAAAMATAERAAEAVLSVAGTVATLAETVTKFITVTQQTFREVFDRLKHTEDKIDLLVNSQMRTDENIRETDKHLRETDAQLQITDKQLRTTDKQLQETDRRLRDLAALFERHIREDHKGLRGAEN